jgi:DNA-binding NarL/FixJ family response regulator
MTDAPQTICHTHIYPNGEMRRMKGSRDECFSPWCQRAAAAERREPQTRREELLAIARTLTPAERKVFDALLGPERVEKIAQRFALTPKTIKNQQHAVFSKLGVKSRAELMSAFVVPPGNGEW